MRRLLNVPANVRGDKRKTPHPCGRHDKIGAMMEKTPQIYAIPAAAVLALAACWWLTAAMSADFYAPGGAAVWQNPSYGALFLMWAVMMAAMMSPSAAPFLALVWRFAAQQKDRPATITTAAAGGYFFVWAVFSAAAAAFHWTAAAALNDSMALANPNARAALFLAAGIYQWTPLKFACLRGCRPAAVFLILHWRRGMGGAFITGARNGVFCAGCCWALMLLLFAGGVMDWRWILALSLLALAEKILPHPELFARAAGTVLFALAAAVFFGFWV